MRTQIPRLSPLGAKGTERAQQAQNPHFNVASSARWTPTPSRYDMWAGESIGARLATVVQ